VVGGGQGIGGDRSDREEIAGLFRAAWRTRRTASWLLRPLNGAAHRAAPVPQGIVPRPARRLDQVRNLLSSGQQPRTPPHRLPATPAGSVLWPDPPPPPGNSSRDRARAENRRGRAHLCTPWAGNTSLAAANRRSSSAGPRKHSHDRSFARQNPTAAGARSSRGATLSSARERKSPGARRHCPSTCRKPAHRGNRADSECRRAANRAKSHRRRAALDCRESASRNASPVRLRRGACRAENTPPGSPAKNLRSRAPERPPAPKSPNSSETPRPATHSPECAGAADYCGI